MRARVAVVSSLALVLAGCQTPVDPPAPPVSSEESSSATNTPDSSNTPTDAPEGFVEARSPDYCKQFDPSTLEWFDLGLGAPQPRSTEQSQDIQLSRTALPPSTAERYNTIAEVCPGFFLVTTFDGSTAVVSIKENRYAAAASLTPAGSLDNPSDPGVVGGGPSWGFRDSLVAGDYLYLSDGVVDEVGQCVAVALHRVPVADVLTPGDTASEVIYRSSPCVSYTDNYRAGSPLKVHLGGALAYRASADEIYLSIGDFHMGASRIAQAEAIGVDNLESDYDLLRSEDAAVSAVIAISDPADAAEARIFAKGLRNSLGMTVVHSDRLWLTDHGPSGGDELNLIEEGGDYGWPLTAEGQPYDRGNYPEGPNGLPAPWLDIYQAPLDGAISPFRSWSPAIAPTAVVQYPDSAAGIEQWAGDLLIASLRGQAIIHLALEDDSTVTEDRLELGERIRDMIVTSAGELLLVTDSSQLLVVSD